MNWLRPLLYAAAALTLLMVSPLAKFRESLVGTVTSAEKRIRLILVDDDSDGEPGTAIFLRFKLRRQAIAYMRADLLNLVAAESASYAQEPLLELPNHQWRRAWPDLYDLHFDWKRVQEHGSTWRWVTLETGDGWWATLTSDASTAMACSVFVGPPDPDLFLGYPKLTFDGRRPGEPFCWRQAWASRTDP